MKIVILNGDMTQGESDFSEYVDKLAEGLRQNHSVRVFQINKMDIHYCTGCWSCWWKTPGRCAIKDDAEEILSAAINSNFFIFASPLMAGFTSSALKKITDRFVSLLQPYIELKKGERRHRKRYKNYPDFGLLLQKEADTDSEDLEIVNDIYDRLALNFHSQKRFVKYTDHHKIEDVIHETCNI